MLHVNIHEIIFQHNIYFFVYNFCLLITLLSVPIISNVFQYICFLYISVFFLRIYNCKLSVSVPIFTHIQFPSFIKFFVSYVYRQLYNPIVSHSTMFPHLLLSCFLYNKRFLTEPFRYLERLQNLVRYFDYWPNKQNKFKNLIF